MPPRTIATRAVPTSGTVPQLRALKPRLERTLTAIALLATLAASGMALHHYGTLAFGSDQPLTLQIETVAFVSILLWLLCGNVVFQITRFVFWSRLQRHRPPARSDLEAIYDRAAPSVCVLIPSYREEPRTLRQTVVSAALAEYPSRRIVVLLDDPPHGNRSELQALDASRALITSINEVMVSRARDIAEALEDIVPGSPREAEAVAELYERVASWLEADASDEDCASQPAVAHTDRLFAGRVLREPAAAHRRFAAELRRGTAGREELDRQRRRLRAMFQVSVESFERKQYAALSHVANKAMNLNAYIGLMGASWRSVESAAGELRLERCETTDATLSAPNADFLLILDADSLVLSDYLLKLVPVIEREPRMAVIGSPYTAVPQAQAVLERIAGASTDVHFCVHQGLTPFNANFWVGACALVRLEALRDIQTAREERGHRVPVFISDRTVIEDTEASIDLVRAGWTLHSYPERLAYSATPPDFGALIIQRRRWANGGLLILPTLLRRRWRSLTSLRGCAELMMRSYYLGAASAMTFAMIALLFFPFSDALASLWLPAAATPYYVLYGRDLRSCGHRWSDLLRAHALNLVLLPVCLQGLLASIYQGLTGRKAAFGRTPKIAQRTRIPALHALTQWLVLIFIANILISDLIAARYLHAIFSLTNEAFFLYGFVAFVGPRASWQDACSIDIAAGHHVRSRLDGVPGRLSLALRSIASPLKRTALIAPEARAIAPTAQGADGP